MPLRDIPGPAGRLEALLDEPQTAGTIDADGQLAVGHASGMRAAVVFAHPHTQLGGTMHTKVVYRTAKALSRIGCAVLRFNFRGAGRSTGSFTDGPGEMDDFRAALDFMRERYPDARLWAGGMSFGSWIALNVGVRRSDVSTLVGIAPPVARYDFEAVALSQKPKFFIQGSHDEVCPLKDMRQFYARAVDPKELAVIDGADHLFDGQVSEVADAIQELLGDWHD
jgi:alpha/beta superfamily hydrolase